MNKEGAYIQTISFLMSCLNSSVSESHRSTKFFKENKNIQFRVPKSSECSF